MNRTPNSREHSHARRRPSNTARPNPQAAPSRQNTAGSYRSGQPHRQNPERIERNNPVGSRQSTPVRKVTSLTRNDEKKLAKREEKALQAANAEKEWQKEVVRTRSGPDIFLLVMILLLLAAGSVMVFSASYPLALKESRPSNYYIIKQLKFLLGGGVIMMIMAILPSDIYRRINFGKKLQINVPLLAFAVSCLFLAYTLVAGIAEGETMRWVKIGPITLQPSELMKISIILVLAWYCEKYEKQIKDPLPYYNKRSIKFNVVLPICICGLGCGMILAGRHLSGTVITALIAFFLLIIGGINMVSFLVAAIPLAGGVIGAFLIAFPYARARIETMFDKNADKFDEAWQTTQSIYAIGSGGIWGVGLGESRQKYSYLGNAHTDFIFSIWCEELGFVFAALLIAAFLVFVGRGYVIASRAPDKFTMMTAFGISTHVGLQALLNMAVATSLIPNTGITLPFFSYGGSSLIVLMMEMGILLSISKRSYKKKSDIEREALEAKYNLT